MSDLELPARAQPRRTAWPVAALALLWLAMLTVGTGSIDDTVLRSLYAGGHPVAVAVAQFLTVFGNGPVAILIAALGAAILWLRGHPRRGFALLGVTFVGRMLVEAQKYAIMRMRPQDETHLVQVSSPSFPSAHAANSMILWVTLALVLFSGTRHRHLALGAALAMALAVGTSRVVLGVHWPTDVIGGWAFGLLWVLIALPVAERVLE